MLGSGGWMATLRRATSCLLWTSPAGALMLDAGTGVAALCQQPTLIGDAGKLDVVLTHFHLDHIAGLTYLPAIATQTEITVWAPGQLLNGTASSAILQTLVDDPYLSIDLPQFARVQELKAGGNTIGAFSVEARVQKFHPGGSVGLRIGDELAYCADTAPDPGTSGFAHEVGTLVHEAWTIENPSAEHSSAASAARTAADAGVGRLVLSHVHPLADDPVGLLAAARPIFPNAEVGYDGMDIG